MKIGLTNPPRLDNKGVSSGGVKLRRAPWLRRERPTTDGVVVVIARWTEIRSLKSFSPHDHCEALRADRIAPRRSEIDPRRIENVLEQAFILECTADGEARFRIAGMALGDLMGMEVRGMPATALVQPQDRARFSALLRDLCRNAEIADLTLATVSGARAEMPLLPMTGEDGRVSRILGCMVARPGAAPPPVRLTWSRYGARASSRRPPIRFTRPRIWPNSVPTW